MGAGRWSSVEPLGLNDLPLPNCHGMENFVKVHDKYAIVGGLSARKDLSNKYVASVLEYTTRRRNWHFFSTAGVFHEKTFVYDPSTQMWSYGPNTPPGFNLYYNCALNLNENEPELFILGMGKSTPHLYNFDTGGPMQPISGNFVDLPRSYPR